MRASMLLCLWATACCAAELPEKLSLELLLQKRQPLEQDCYGANCLLLGRPVWYTDPSFMAKYKEAGKPFFRFPGGTPANFYNPQRGLRDEVPESGRDYGKENERVKLMTRGRGQKPAEFFEFAEATGARYSVVLNICTRTVEQNREWLAEAAEKGVEIPCFEIGNELYFEAYAWAFRNPRDYLRRARETSAMVRDLFPKAKIGVLVPSHIYTHESFLEEGQPANMARQQQWLEMLEGLTFFDAVVVHLYSQTGMDGKVEESDFLPFVDAFSNVVAYMKEHLDPALKRLETQFPDKEIWVTEYGVGGFSGNLRKYGLRSSHLGALHSDLMLLRFLSRPSVKVSHWHSFSHFLEYDYKQGGIGKGTHLSFLHFTMFAEAVRKSELYVPLKIGGSSAMEGGAFIGREKGYLILINKGPERCVVDALKSKKTLKVSGALQLSPRKDVALAEALQETQFINKTEMTGKALEAIEIAPYSITRIEFEWE
ncbi:hypothetical protein PDESU_04732 [Pontiella desulfatans]|uniref:Uncharacterized protein n=1 Tax=Pontiella desulfatans TaxID=2750659 RepID=A0A6C2U7R3_PONDE|nr:hypothetical protein [Pontiella desulfatans]VGO16142.1 hypothetical protein PDESU_04732 [Pontiella desulfatans]